MILTETEAKKKTCPQSFVNNNSGTCRGTQCMAWRWNVELLSMGTQFSKTHGYCGLAGKP
jgi:hypothetical protein